MTTQERFRLVCLGHGFTQMQAPALTPDFTPPLSYSAEGSSRKFIVLADHEGNLVLAIGPPMEGASYYHKDILKNVERRFAGLVISGGGSLTVSWCSYGKKWTVKFGGCSTDFGVYDFRLLDKEVRTAITDQLGLPCTFEWRG